MNRLYKTTTYLNATIAALLLLPLSVSADALPDHDNGPLTGLFGFPDSSDGGTIVTRGLHDWDTSIVTASHSISEARGTETLVLDGETTRIALAYRYGVSTRFDIGIEVPYLWHQSGSLDATIDRWHKIFGLPDGPRDIRERDQLEFLYVTPEGTRVNFTNNAHGVGDIRLLAGWLLSKTEYRRAALQFGIKLATGKSDTFLGSGGTDLSFGIAVDRKLLWGNARLSGLYRANVTYLGEPDRLADRYNDIVGQFAFGIAYHLNQHVDLRLQSRIRSAVYDSEIENLGDPSVSLTFGADFKVSKTYRLGLSVGEDLLPGSAPDVSFQITLRHSNQQ